MQSDDLNPSATSNRIEGRWDRQEHLLFLKALIKFGKDWKMVEDYVGTRTGPQVRSHSQKYFLKLHKIHKDRRKLRHREHIEKTETEKEILQLFTEDDITINTPPEMASIVRHQLYSPLPSRKAKPIPPSSPEKMQKGMPQPSNAFRLNREQTDKQCQNNEGEAEQIVVSVPLTRKRSQNKIIKALQQIKQEENNEEDSYLIYVMKKNKDYFMSGKEIMGLIDFGHHEQEEEEEETTTKRKKSFALVQESGQENRRELLDKNA